MGDPGDEQRVAGPGDLAEEHVDLASGLGLLSDSDEQKVCLGPGGQRGQESEREQYQAV